MSARTSAAHPGSVDNARVYLASASPRRAEILTHAGIRFVAAPVPIEEESIIQGFAEPIEAAIAVARAKAQTAQTFAPPGAVVLAADTLVLLGRRIMGKPKDSSEATQMLRQLQGMEHHVITGVAVAHGHRLAADAEKTIVRFRRCSDAEISDYVASGSPLDKAGAYGIQDEGFSPVAALRGCRLNVVGLPLCLTVRLFAATGASNLLPPMENPVCPDHNQARGVQWNSWGSARSNC